MQNGSPSAKKMSKFLGVCKSFLKCYAIILKCQSNMHYANVWAKYLVKLFYFKNETQISKRKIVFFLYKIL